MKALIFLLLFAPSLSFAAPFVCFSGVSKPHAAIWSDQPEAVIELARWNPSCETMGNISTGLNATSLVFSGLGLGLACTGIGLPATLWLEGAAVGVQALNLIVGQLPCDNRTRDAEIKKMAELVVCEELQRQGIRCSIRL